MDAVVTPGHDLAGRLRALVAGVLPDAVDPADGTPLRQYGLDSMAAARLWLEIQAEFGVDLPLEWLATRAGVDELVERIGAESGDRAPSPAVEPDPDNRFEPFPLTPIQQSYLVGRQPELTPDPVGCHQYLEFEVDGLDVERLRAAWQRLVRHHDMLRAVVTGDGRQRVRADAPQWTLPVHDAEADFDATVLAVRERLSVRRYGAGEWPLFAIEACVRRDGPSRVHLSIDALIVDGHSIALLLHQWARCYADPQVPLPEPELTARDCLQALYRQRDTADFRADLGYWAGRLRDLPPGPVAGSGDGGWARQPFTATVPAAQWQALRDRATELDVTPTSLLLNVFAEVLARAGAAQPFSVVVTTNDRLRLPSGAAGVVGPFTSSVVLPLDTLRLPLETAVRRVHGQVWEALDHGAVSGVEALRERRRAGPDVPLPVVFTGTLGARDDARPDGGFGAAVVHGVSQTSGVALDAQVWEQGDGLRIRWDVAPGQFPPGLVETAFAAFRTALALAATPGTPAVAPLNELQQAYFVSRSTGTAAGWTGCQMYQSVDVTDLDVPRLERTLRQLIDEYPAMRSTISHDGRLLTLPAAPSAWHVPVVDLGDDPARVLDALRDELTGRGFPLGRWPQFDVRVTRQPGRPATVHCGFDLTVFDARSIHLLVRELFRRYADPDGTPYLPGGRQSLVPAALPSGYRQWSAAELPSGPAVAGRSDGRRIRLSGRLERWDRLVGAAAERGLSVDAVLLAAFGDALSTRYPGDFTLPVVRWSTEDDRSRPGEFTALTWVVREAAHQGNLEAAATGGLGEVRRRVLRDNGFVLPVVYTSVVDLDGTPLPAGTRAGRWLSCTPEVSLDCIGVVDGGVLEYCWDAVEDDFDATELPAMFAAYGATLDAFAGAAEPAVPYPTDRLMHSLFEDRVRERPAAVALRGAGWTRTYAELNRQANGIAWRLRELGVVPETVVGIRIRRGPDMVAAVLGVLKAGGAYLPIEPSLPDDRAGYMLALTRAPILLTTTDLAARPVPSTVAVNVVDDAATGGPDRDPEPAARPENTAYVIFTSGSTGRPKGVAVAHRPVLNLLNWCYRTFDFRESDVGLAVTSLGFDLSVFDLFGLLGRGASLYLADEEQQKDPALLLDVLIREPVTFWNSAPTTLSQLAPLLPTVRGRPGTGNLRLVFLSGDYTPLSLPDEVRASFPNARIVSLGGATEATVWSNYFVVERIDPGWRSIPYGRPIDNARYHILDERGEPCAVGVEGDLYIGGECLALGYHNQPALTAERFVPDPFATAPGARMYRTGDRASWFPDGNMCFLGRVDSQVKIRGFRVELEEIEHRMRQHPAVKDAVVVARPDRSGDRKLVAYLLARSADRPAARELREHAAQTLPDYMVPNLVCFLDTFPATANGKLDRDALPWPLDAPTTVDSPSTPDADRLAVEIAGWFAEALGRNRIEPDEDLWDLGATSFTVVVVSNALQERYQQRIPVSALLAEPTAAGIARQLAGPVEPPATVDFFSGAERQQFKAGQWSTRPLNTADRSVPLEVVEIADEHYGWRASRRDFAPEPLPYQAFCRLLSLLRDANPGGRTKRLYPSAGDTYAVQVYLHVREGGIEGVPAGTYYYRPADHALQALREGAQLDRSLHFYYNRPLFDAAGFELYLIGQTAGIAPVYGDAGERYLLLEAGYLSQLLMMGQAACGVGLCPIGEVAVDRLREELRLDDGHRFLQAFVGGPVTHPTRTAAGERPAFSGPPGAIAVVGMSGRYPGANDLAAYWRNLSTGRRSVGTHVPARAVTPGPAVTGGFLDGVDDFDSLLFHIAPAEAATLDPQLRVLLPVVWECLEEAGYTPAALQRAAGRVGVFVGVMWQDHQQVGADLWRRTGAATLSATASDIPNRISHVLDLRGPSLAVDTSCASSLTALHLAMQSIRAGECGAAIVAAVNLVAHPYHIAALAGLDLLAPGGATVAFDAGSSGWSPGEGAGALLLRPAARAAEDGDTVHGLIEGTWVGHAGHTNRFGAPDADRLADSLDVALRQCGIEPGDIDYVECAAAGASVADAAEIEALSRTFSNRPVPIGTVKPNIGHLESASGLAQLAKVLLQMRYRQLAPTLTAERPNPLIPWENLPLRPVRRLEPWPAADPGRPRRALVNALGATGSYGHVVVRAVDGG